MVHQSEGPQPVCFTFEVLQSPIDTSSSAFIAQNSGESRVALRGGGSQKSQIYVAGEGQLQYSSKGVIRVDLKKIMAGWGEGFRATKKILDTPLQNVSAFYFHDFL